MRSLRLGIDLDNVIYDFPDALASYISVTTGRPKDEMPPATRWEFYKDWGYTTKQFLDYFAKGVDSGFLFRVGAPMPGSQEALQRLRDAGHTLHLFTDRSVGSVSMANTEWWLNYYAVPYDTITFAVDKTIVDVDAAIDDKPENVDALRAKGVAAFLYDRGRSDQVGHPWLVSSWQEFESEVAALCLRTRNA